MAVGIERVRPSAALPVTEESSCKSAGTSHRVTDDSSRTDAGTPLRNAPDLTCAACATVIPRDVCVVHAHLEHREQRSFLGNTWEAVADRIPTLLCEPCWQGGTEWTDGRRRRVNGEVYDCAAEKSTSPWLIYGNCPACGRRVLADTYRRRWWACSKRCQVYASRAAWPKPPRRSWHPNREQCRTCDTALPPGNRGQKFCSSTCRQRNYRRRQQRLKRLTT